MVHFQVVQTTKHLIYTLQLGYLVIPSLYLFAPVEIAQKMIFIPLEYYGILFTLPHDFLYRNDRSIRSELDLKWR